MSVVENEVESFEDASEYIDAVKPDIMAAIEALHGDDEKYLEAKQRVTNLVAEAFKAGQHSGAAD